MTYRPLPDFLYIGFSDIDGNGLFSKSHIDKGIELGITHVKDDRFEDGYIRTPLGAFFNHSKNPNCEAYIQGDFIMLKTIKDIKTEEELTAFYWLYSLEDKDD
tara:strand:- start:18004 stop:18312 length:309 start_codon:yes stop_codon:yes gene_type:complete